MTDENIANDTNDFEAPEAVETPDTDETAIADPAEGTEMGAPAEASAEEAPAEVKPREIIRGIHPELRCEDPECGPEFTELQFFSPEEATKIKGKIMLFCARSGKKYFAPAPELQTWIAENKIVRGRGRKDG